MARIALTLAGFVLIGLAVGLFVWVGYELSLVFTDYYDRSDQETLQPVLGVIMLTAVTLGLAGRMLMRSGRGRRWR
jgi:multisubunit Na+/H+ antiporter MnhC subunit